MNIKVLTAAERKYLNEKYTFSFDDKNVYVKVNNYARITAHPISENFYIKNDMRRMTISVMAISLWKSKYFGKHSLIDVQNAINYLKVSYQEVNDETIDSALKSIRTKDAERYV